MTIERSILETAARLRRQREAHLIATVVRVKGSAYRRPGARMLLTQFRWISGSVSGGCLEGDIASKGWWRTRDGDPMVLTYDSSLPTGAGDDDIRAAFGLGCDGVVEVMLERGNVPGRIDPLEVADRCLRTQQRGAIATVIHSRLPSVKIGARVAVLAASGVTADPLDELLRVAMIADARAAIASGLSGTRTYNAGGGSVDVFVEAVLPPPRVFVFGTGHDAVPVVQAAKSLGWDVSVCTSQLRVVTRQRFAFADEILVGTPEELGARIDECERAVAIVMGHHYETDRANLGMLLGTRARYIGVLGPRPRTERMLDDLGQDADDDPRLHAPIGLEIGAETPAEIALAIVAEVQSVIRRAPARSLRHRIGPIHVRPSPRRGAAVAEPPVGLDGSPQPRINAALARVVPAEPLDAETPPNPTASATRASGVHPLVDVDDLPPSAAS